MTGKADDHQKTEAPKESTPAPEAAQRSGVIGDPFKHAEWRATQQERIQAQEHSATDLLQDKHTPQPTKSKFELVDNAATKRKELLARAKEQEDTGSLIAKEAKKNPAAEPVKQLKQWADKLPAGAEKEQFEKLVREQAADLSPELAARMKERGVAAPDNAGNAHHRADHSGKEEQRSDDTQRDASTVHALGFVEVGQKLAALPFLQQAQIIGNGLMAGVEQYSYQQRERQWGALIGTVQGVGDTAINMAKIADFSAYCIIGDKGRAGKMGEEFGTSLGQSIISGINIFEGAKHYGENIKKTGDVGKPIRDVIAVGQMLDRQWEKLPPREQERQKNELIGQLISDQLIGSHGAQSIGKAEKFTEVLGCVSKEAAEHGGHTVNEITEATTKISQLTQDLLSPELGLPSGGKIKASQLETGEYNIAKALGRVAEHEAGQKPLFLRVGEERLLKEGEIELKGGLKRLESLTPEELQKEGLQRYEMPKLDLWWSASSFTANIPGTGAKLKGAMLGAGEVEIINIDRGILPQGAGAHFLAEVLRAHHAIPTKELYVSFISNAATKEACMNNVPADQSLLGRHVIKALKELGLEAKSTEWDVQGKVVNISVKIKE